MTGDSEPQAEGARADKTDASSPLDPIEFIIAEHHKHRRMCKALERLAVASTFDPAEIAALVDFIRFDLTLHLIDEEEDLFPLLRRRCLAEDGVELVLDRMVAEHAEDKELSARARDVLNACLIERKPPAAIAGASAALLAFAEHEKRHLTLEDAVLVPLARRRLTAADRISIGQRMQARRRRLV